MAIKNIRLGEVLVDSGYLSEDQLKSALEIQKNSGGKKLGDILLDLSVITEEQLLDALHTRLNVPLIDLRNVTIPLDVIRLVPEAMARKNTMIPVRLQGDSIIYATNDPLNYYGANELEIATGRSGVPNLAAKQDIENAIDKYYASSSANEVAQDAGDALPASAAELANIDFTDAELRASSAPVVRLVNTLIEQAYKQRASDIHIEPEENFVRVRFRIDGDLAEIMTLKPVLLGPVITRIKLQANMNIAEKRLPQDGRMTAEVAGTRVSIRVSTISTVYGEKAVLRLLADSRSGIMSINELGINEYNMGTLLSLIRSPNGIVLATGPTGSGKSTTLYAVLSELSTPERNVVTIEDPIEKVIEGINQTQVNPKAGLNFASGLRSLLRQDPDVMMVGEIRDEETAEIAAAAAITGHLVLSTLHTNDASSAYMRFIDMGILPYIVASSIVGIIAQRLVKKICPHCRTEYAPGEEELKQLEAMGVTGVDSLWLGKGCARCNYTGYYGRTAIYEIIHTDPEIRALVTTNAKAQEIREYLKSKGFHDMRSNALDLMLKGVTTFKEMLAKTYSVEGTY